DIPGDQMCWAVYNDLDPTAHSVDAGGTVPLGVEVQQTTWGYNRSSPWNGTVLMRFVLVNRGPNTLSDVHVGFWADPDLGGVADDLVGSDRTLNLAYAYNATNADLAYGDTPPAIGYCLLQGPQLGAPGTNLPATAAVAFVNGSDPASASQSFNSLHGLTTAGAPIHD